jgi:hypothetical protein
MPEYIQVDSYLRQKLAPSDAARVHVHSIERLAVPDTRDAYDLILKQMVRREDKRRRAGRQALDADRLELAWVFHACAADAVDNIIAGGFNRSYAGKNATVYGPGSYFARDASYSARPTYSPPDAQGLKRMFLCRLAIGAHTSVPHGYSGKEPPTRDPEALLGVGTLKYDTTSNGNLDVHGVPEILVAFKDNQAYAEFLVTFRLG